LAKRENVAGLGKYMALLSKYDIKPDLHVYNTVIRIFGAKGDVEKMSRYYERMKKQSIFPDKITFSVMLRV
jgi:pentatricopeptide repeat protein